MKEIGDWIEDNEQENKDPRRSSDEFLQRYAFADIYKIFFGSIHIELHQWLSRLIERRKNFQEDQFPPWTPARIAILKRVNNTISHAVDFWIARTLEAFVTKVAIDTSTSFSEDE